MIYSPNSALVARLVAYSRQLREALALLRNSDQRASVQRACARNPASLRAPNADWTHHGKLTAGRPQARQMVTAKHRAVAK
jgi:hypothetical protein